MRGAVFWIFWDDEDGLLCAFGHRDNTVFIIEAHRPAKKDALRYLDDGAAAPPKFAHVRLAGVGD